MRMETTEALLFKELVSTEADIVLPVIFVQVIGCSEISAAEALSKKQ